MLKRASMLIRSQGCQSKEIRGVIPEIQAWGKCFVYLETQEEEERVQLKRKEVN